VFLTPLLVLAYLGDDSSIDFLTVLFKLGVRVLLPLFVGQIIQFFFVKIKQFVADNKFYFKKSQEFALVFIVYTVFCKNFYDDGTTSSASDVGATTEEGESVVRGAGNASIMSLLHYSNSSLRSSSQ
jgi:predicted Na+-dependent transporter